MPVVLVHGGGVAGWMWNPLRRFLPPAWEVIVPDLPGHGGSAGEPFIAQERTTLDLRSYLEAEVGKPCAVVGFSFGAQIAVQLASRAPDLVSHVAVISAQAKPSRFPKLTLGLLAAAAPLARRPGFARSQAKQLFVPDDLLEDYVRTSSRLTTRTLVRVVEDNIRFTVPSGWPAFGGSALVLAGQNERGFMKESARALHQALPTSDLAIVDDCGHGIPLQRPEWLADRLRAQYA
ncbi:alpha/beta hydrolase [Amycolatopsis thailandensis]|uniref:Alpha/beta hydrolase n=2 Tax=Amycolatopsis thailandensis TaxID=589330 RepID=A0A229SB85_9PSEU|nr:alpha/beta hydrolase [Amycolatopsis thailandensis]